MALLSRSSSSTSLVCVVILMLTWLLISCMLVMDIHAEDVPELKLDYYEKSCPRAQEIVKRELECAFLADYRLAASVLRLHFHDCFVQGCDGSVLFDDTETLIGEKTAKPNVNSLRGFELIDKIKSALEAECPGVVSCADLLTIAARDAVKLSGGPYWDVYVGRKDSRTASIEGANSNIPLPQEGIPTLLYKFYAQGVDLTDMVALSGAHTIGYARCTNFRDRIYGDFKDTIGGNPLGYVYLNSLQSICPQVGGDDTITALDNIKPKLFDNSYYQKLTRGEGLLNSDQELYSNWLAFETKPKVVEYSMDIFAFFKQFTESMSKMGNITDPGSYVKGEVRKNCRYVNAET